jgi:hypothetical protein
MFIHALLGWLLLAALFLLGLFAVALSHFVLMRAARLSRDSTKKRPRIPSYFIAAGFVFLQLLGKIYNPGAAFLLQAKCDEDADKDDQGDPESPEKQLSRQLRQIRRGEPVDGLVLRL